MFTYLCSRLAQSVLVIVAVVFAAAIIPKLVPGDAVDVLLDSVPGMTREDAAGLREQLGLNRSAFEQFVAYGRGLMRGDLGQSIRYQEPAADLIRELVGPTVELAMTAMLVSLLVGLPLGIGAAIDHGGPLDRLANALSMLGVTVPAFLIGILSVLLFSVSLNWLPSSGYRGSTVAAILDVGAPDYLGQIWNRGRFLILPSLSLAAANIAFTARITRSAMLEAGRQDYVQFARAKGLPPLTIQLRHVFRNAAVPVFTLTTLQLGTLMSGAFVIENVFAWPGIGRLAVQAVAARDYTIVQAIMLLSTVVFVTLNLLVDLSYRLLDPRMRHERR